MGSEIADDLIKGAEAASAATGLTRRAIYWLVETGQVPVKKQGRTLYFSRKALAEALLPGLGA